MPRRIIGIHSGHDSSACLLVDNVLVAAIARELRARTVRAGQSANPDQVL
jgi:carbamoyltransferase